MTVLTVMGAAGIATADTAPIGCGQWTASTVASGYGTLENLAFDGRGGLLLSEVSLGGSGGGLQRLTADGVRATVAEIESPGGIVVTGTTAFVNSGNTARSGLSDAADGSIRAVDLTTGAITTAATGLTMPNGLAQLPDGGFVVSRDLGADTTLTRVAPDGSTHPLAPGLTSTNGLAYDPARRKLFVSTTFDAVSTLAAFDADNLTAEPARITIPGPGPLNAADDLTVGPDGAVYVALNVLGQVVRVDPETQRTCVVASGLPFTTSVRFGSGPGWDAHSLYATSFLGTVTRLTP
ncbi:SMP-30/gluconolactonase/LRE family protein [Nocardia huaxiensis]|uniref:SMP-30/gluconolactonase/LRE family protein n=1 Tax=Nocardia huaxiensis TaxID=2755382 RepID=A0A7D6VDB3_9NOCA|nr:SMP-30/gluconolactonase/LRE family protein [Nocardia huaxiensis]QLY32551.1 SMP-30/gluconolactonase/LRE family protein [Nocardia huaxiensis]